MFAKIRPPRRPVSVGQDWIPQRTLEWQEDDEGKVFLLKEKSRNQAMKWLIRKAGKNQFFRIHLDRFGTKAWQLADGSRSVAGIAAVMREEFGEDLKDPAERVARFFAMLASSRFVVFRRPEDPE